MGMRCCKRGYLQKLGVGVVGLGVVLQIFAHVDVGMHQSVVQHLTRVVQPISAITHGTCISNITYRAHCTYLHATFSQCSRSAIIKQSGPPYIFCCACKARYEPHNAIPFNMVPEQAQHTPHIGIRVVAHART